MIRTPPPRGDILLGGLETRGRGPFQEKNPIFSMETNNPEKEDPP